MAKRKQLWHPDETRKRIQTSQLINRLQLHALSRKEVMTTSQVAAAKLLLAKVLPDLATTEITGPGGGAQQHEHKLIVEFE